MMQPLTPREREIAETAALEAGAIVAESWASHTRAWFTIAVLGWAIAIAELIVIIVR